MIRPYWSFFTFHGSANAKKFDFRCAAIEEKGPFPCILPGHPTPPPPGRGCSIRFVSFQLATDGKASHARDRGRAEAKAGKRGPKLRWRAFGDYTFLNHGSLTSALSYLSPFDLPQKSG
jgi:hypothetical protein